MVADNYGVDATIIDYRDDTGTSGPPSHYKVLTDSGAEFWALDHEVFLEPGSDSKPGTIAHIQRVQELLEQIRCELAIRATHHDDSKLREPERLGYDALELLISGATYGTPEYAAVMADPRVKAATDHHVRTNRHHPQFHANGINDMTLIDLIEMFCDWKAASERGSGRPLAESLALTCERWGMSPQLTNIFKNTRKDMGW